MNTNIVVIASAIDTGRCGNAVVCVGDRNYTVKVDSQSITFEGVSVQYLMSSLPIRCEGKPLSTIVLAVEVAQVVKAHIFK